MRYHLSNYHGYRQMWMYGVSDEELESTHAACFYWCHKPERDRGSVINERYSYKTKRH